MISKAPSHESDQRTDDELKKLQVLTYKPKPTFRRAAKLFVAIHGPRVRRRYATDISGE
jgi:hypothetical protein